MAKTESFQEMDGKIVMPGDVVLRLPEQGQVRIGPGLQQQGEALVASLPGILRSTAGGKLWLEARQRRYTPVANDAVIGLILNRMGESFTVDINGPCHATLPLLAFEGATRRNRPNLKAGDLVFARLAEAHRDMEPELSCMDLNDAASGFGPLEGGYQLEITSSHARRLLGNPRPATLKALGAALQFEMVVGQNGRVWVKSPDSLTTITVVNAVEKTELLSESQCKVFVQSLLESLPVVQAAVQKESEP